MCVLSSIDIYFLTFYFEVYVTIFNARRYVSAVYAVIMCSPVCLSVCPSDTSRHYIGSCKQCHMIAQGL